MMKYKLRLLKNYFSTVILTPQERGKNLECSVGLRPRRGKSIPPHSPDSSSCSGSSGRQLDSSRTQNDRPLENSKSLGEVIARDLRALAMMASLVLLLCSLQNCTQPQDPVFDNPNDSLSQTFTEPDISLTIEGPVDGANWLFRRTAFSWTGNSTTAMYSYKLDTAGWSAWSAATRVEFESLDDDVHKFQVKGQHRNGSNETVTLKRTFTIDLLPHPSFFIVPNLTRPKVGDRFFLYLRVKNIDSLMTMSTVLSYSRTVFSVEAVEVVQAFMTKNNGKVVALTSNDANAGRIEANLGIALGKPKGVQGTGNLLRFQCLALSAGAGSLSIKTDSTVVKDTSGVSVGIAGFANGSVIVQ